MCVNDMTKTEKIEKFDLEASSGLLQEDVEQLSHQQDKIGKKFDFYSIFCDSLRCPMEPKISFVHSLLERTGWLAGLLIFQSCSSFILEANINLMESHPAIIYFLTVRSITSLFSTLLSHIPFPLL